MNPVILANGDRTRKPAGQLFTSGLSLAVGIQAGPKGETNIFDPIPDTRSARSRFWCLLASILLNLSALSTIAIVSEIYAVRNFTEQLANALQKELGNYKMVLLISPKIGPAAREPTLRKPKRPIELAKPQSQLARDTRILDRLDPRLVEFVKENPALESILTREMTRDIDRKVLTVDTFLKKTSLRVGFEIDEDGKIVKRKMEKSSRVPSIDHLALEVISLLEKYRFLAPMKGLKRVTALIEVDEEIEIRFEGEAPDETTAEEIRGQLQNMLALMRFALGKSEAAFMLDDISLVSREKHVEVSKAFEKQPFIDFLMQSSGAERRPEKPPDPPSPNGPSQNLQ